jgi:3-hydroxyacyl-CoA dehydrogenase
MHYADHVGLKKVVEAMNRFANNPHADSLFWKPAPRLTRLAVQGRTFNTA